MIAESLKTGINHVVDKIRKMVVEYGELSHDGDDCVKQLSEMVPTWMEEEFPDVNERLAAYEMFAAIGGSAMGELDHIINCPDCLMEAMKRCGAVQVLDMPFHDL